MAHNTVTLSNGKVITKLMIKSDRNIASLEFGGKYFSGYTYTWDALLGLMYVTGNYSFAGATTTSSYWDAKETKAVRTVTTSNTAINYLNPWKYVSGQDKILPQGFQRSYNSGGAGEQMYQMFSKGPLMIMMKTQTTSGILSTELFHYEKNTDTKTALTGTFDPNFVATRTAGDIPNESMFSINPSGVVAKLWFENGNINIESSKINVSGSTFTQTMGTSAVQASTYDFSQTHYNRLGQEDSFVPIPGTNRFVARILNYNTSNEYKLITFSIDPGTRAITIHNDTTLTKYCYGIWTAANEHLILKVADGMDIYSWSGSGYIFVRNVPVAMCTNLIVYDNGTKVLYLVVTGSGSGQVLNLYNFTDILNFDTYTLTSNTMTSIRSDYGLTYWSLNGVNSIGLHALEEDKAGLSFTAEYNVSQAMYKRVHFITLTFTAV